MSKARYITTTLPYVNAEPHIGFAYEVTASDALARFYRLEGEEVFFSTGVDEHGLKIFQRAQEEGREVQEYADHYAEEFRKLKEALNLSNNAFIRTTDEKHIKAAQEIWRRCEKAGDIYKKKYKGLYCIGDEVFLKESDLVEGKCPNHQNQDPIILEEENYFFRLSKYQNWFLDEYLTKEGVIVPEWRRQEAIAFVRGGLEDFSISREKERLSWGIPVPGDDTQVMYVWFDALTNYISTLGWPDEKDFKTFWEEGETLQLAGKDQIRFQSIIWQAMLHSAGIKPTDSIFYHGFINSGGQKMSKSLGNVIEPKTLVARYGTDATRYLLLRHVHPFHDTDITLGKLDEWYTSHLVNGLGNLVARILQMSSQYLEKPPDLFEVRGMKDVCNDIEQFQLQNALNGIWAGFSILDALITEGAPYKLIKTDRNNAEKQIIYLVKELHRFSHHLTAFMPETSEKIIKAVKENKKPENLFPRL